MRRTCDTTRTHPHGCTRGKSHPPRRPPCSAHRNTPAKRLFKSRNLRHACHRRRFFRSVGSLSSARYPALAHDHVHGQVRKHKHIHMCTEYKNDVGKTKRNATHTTTSRGRKMTHANTQTHKHDLPQHNNSREQRNGPLQIRRKSANMPQAQRTKNEFYSPPARSTNISYIYTFTTKMHDGVRKVEPADPLQEQ